MATMASAVMLDMEEEGELFEINIEAVNSIPPPQYYWESYFTATGNALLANCLLPIDDVSSAVPMVSQASNSTLSSSLSGKSHFLMVSDPMQEKIIGFPFWGLLEYTTRE
ncbi:hypothetical protein L1049_008865 [Liquidambar formosana]|uniref:Uncharacterized protein n=1 Tax=Liquidambar formosana TaxID=63359 RepID=A0AAP0S3N3_LIQFO